MGDFDESRDVVATAEDEADCESERVARVETLAVLQSDGAADTDADLEALGHSDAAADADGDLEALKPVERLATRLDVTECDDVTDGDTVFEGERAFEDGRALIDDDGVPHPDALDVTHAVGVRDGCSDALPMPVTLDESKPDSDTRVVALKLPHNDGVGVLVRERDKLPEAVSDGVMLEDRDDVAAVEADTD